MTVGQLLWVVPDGFIPANSQGVLTSHESICVVNVGDETATVRVTAYFEDRDPLENMVFQVSAKRTRHVKTSELNDAGHCIPVGIPYALTIESDKPIVVQFSRMDATQAENSLMTTMAYASTPAN